MSSPSTDADNPDPHLLPELRGITDRLRREAVELADRYPASESVVAPRSHEHRLEIQDRNASLGWVFVATVATVMLLVAGWAGVGFFGGDDQTRAPTALAVSADDLQGPMPARASAGDTPAKAPGIPYPSIGLHVMSGPELEAVLNLLEDNSTTLKLAL